MTGYSYIVNTIVKQILNNKPDRQGETMIRVDGFENIEIYEAIARKVTELLDKEDLTIEIKLANINPIRYRGYYFDSETDYYYLKSRYYDSTLGRFINADLYEYAKKQKDDYIGLNLFAYCCNDPINFIDQTGFLRIKRWVLGLALDTIFTLTIPYFSGPLDIYGRLIQALAKKKNISLIWNKLLYSVVPKFKGLFGKAFTAIRKAIWRVSGSLISNSFSTLINANITKFVKLISRSRWNKAWDIISCFFSAGSMVAGIIDYVDGNFNGECRLW